MALLPLRAYNRDIEALIQNGQYEEAVAHCRQILRFYPKHLDTYRLLAKAYLERQKYAEAANILERILSAVPDDFVSQIGMSIIREEEGNLDAAIWHMERAHEIQPSNAAIQDELRRLYGKRDGVEPPRIRLTRGALVRMYARGDLYPQAIREIQMALAENRSRIDLEIILARMYFLSGRKVEAAEVCTRLIAAMPYCFEANHILAIILPESSRAEDAKIFQQRIEALDPYLAYMTERMKSPLEVPDEAVQVEYLSLELERPIEEESVFSFIKFWDGPDVPTVQEETDAGRAEDAAPEDLSEIGVLQADSPTEIDAPAEPAAEEKPAAEVEAVAEDVSASQDGETKAEESSDDLPDWLRSLAAADTIDAVTGPLVMPAGTEPEASTAEPVPSEEETFWPEMDPEVAIKLARQQEEDASVTAPEASAGQEVEEPDWLAQVTSLDDQPESAVEPEGLIPLWPAPEIEEQAGEDEEMDQEEIPDWIRGLRISYDEQVPAPDASGPAEPEGNTTDEYSAARPEENGTDSAWLDRISSVITPSQTEAAPAEPASQPEDTSLPDWLRSALDSHSEEEPQPATVPLDRGEWVPAEDYPPADEGAPAEESSDLSWLQELIRSDSGSGSTLSAPDASPVIDFTDPGTPVDEGVLRARDAMRTGLVEDALRTYAGLLDDTSLRPLIIADLQTAVRLYPADSAIWQALGDAYARNNQLAEALEAYDKAEELLR